MRREIARLDKLPTCRRVKVVTPAPVTPAPVARNKRLGQDMNARRDCIRDGQVAVTVATRSRVLCSDGARLKRGLNPTATLLHGHVTTQLHVLPNFLFRPL